MRERPRRAQGRGSGFTLLELMIVVAVIAIIVAIAIPNFIRSRMSANESSAIASMRTISSVIEQYRIRFQTYPDALANLSATGYIDERLGSGAKAGYSFRYAGSPSSYRVLADPDDPGMSGEIHLFLDQSGVIRWSRGGEAGEGDPPIDS